MIYCFFGHDRSVCGDSAVFSQWFPCKFTVDGKQFNCMEQYMMAMKALTFHDKENLEKILNASSPKVIKALGRAVRNFDPAKWDEVKFQIILKGNLCKFSQNPELKKILLATGDAILAEASPYDKIWGIGMRAGEAAQNPAKWKGQNLLGLALTEVKMKLMLE